MKFLSISSMVTLLVLTSILGGERIMAASEKGSNAQDITTSSGLNYVDQVVGTGDVAVSGKTVSVHTGWLENGKSSIARRSWTAILFPLGAGARAGRRGRMKVGGANLSSHLI